MVGWHLATANFLLIRISFSRSLSSWTNMPLSNLPERIKSGCICQSPIFCPLSQLPLAICRASFLMRRSEFPKVAGICFLPVRTILWHLLTWGILSFTHRMAKAVLHPQHCQTSPSGCNILRGEASRNPAMNLWLLENFGWNRLLDLKPFKKGLNSQFVRGESGEVYAVSS